MSAKIKPGEVLEFSEILPNSPNKAFPALTTVVAVRRGCLHVTDADSANGLAKIIVHGTSEENGHYRYEYRDPTGKCHGSDVFDLRTPGGVHIIGVFIE